MLLTNFFSNVKTVSLHLLRFFKIQVKSRIKGEKKVPSEVRILFSGI